MGHLSVLPGALHRLAYQIQHLPWHSRPYRPLQRNAWASLVQTSLWTQTSGFRLHMTFCAWSRLLFTPPGIQGLYSMFSEYSWKVWSFLKSYWESVVLWKKGGRVRERKEWKEEKMWSGYNVWEWNKIK